MGKKIKYFRVWAFKFMIAYLFLTTFLAAGIRGVVADEEGNPIEGVRVSVEGEKLIEEIITEAEGVFNFNVSKADIYFLNFNKLGYENKTVTIDLATGENREINILFKELRRLSGYRVQGEALTSSSERQGIATTRLGQEAIVNMRIIKAEDLSGVSANLYNLSSGSSYTSIFTLRGISSVNTIDPLVGLYIDGVAQFQSYNYPIHLGNIESIEILKGPQITLYGRNAMAGIIDIKTKVPPNRPSVAGSGEWFSGSYNRFGGQSYDLSLSFPLVRDQVYLKGGGFLYNKKGIIYNDYLERFVDDALNFNVFLRNDFFLRGVNFFFQAKYERIREGAFPYNLDQEEALSRPYYVYHNFKNYSDKDIADAVFNFRFPFRLFDITSVWNYQYFKGGLGVDTDFTSSSDTFLKIDFDQHLITEESKILSTEDSSRYFTWSIGNYMYIQKRDIHTESEADVGRSLNTQLDIDEINFGAALFGSITYPILDNFHIIAGLRGDYDYKNVTIDKKVKSTSSQDGEVTTEPQRIDREHFFFFAPKAALNFYIDELNLLYLSVSRGFRSGGINTFTSQPDRALYQPENTWNTEVGLKSRFIPEYPGSLSMNFFYIYWLSPQVNVFLTTGENLFDFGIVNAERSHSLGGEVELDLPILWGFSVGGAYGFSRSVFLDFTPPQSVQVEGNYQPFVPQHTLSAFFQHQYNFEVLSQRDAVINRFDFRYISEIFYDPENTLTQDGYYSFNYTFNIRIDGIIATFWIKNIIDTRYFDFAIPFGTRLTPKLGDPRTIGGKIAFVF